MVVLLPPVHDRVDAEPVDGRIEETVGRGNVEDLQVRAYRVRGEQGRHVCHRVRDITHVDEDEQSDHVGACASQGVGEELDGLASK